MTQREKLIELIRGFLHSSADGDSLADYLISRGVTVRKKGEWIRPTGCYTPTCSVKYQCTACGKLAHYIHGANSKKIRSQKDMICAYKFCPNCGAKMEGE